MEQTQQIVEIYQSNYQFEGKLGTFSRVSHTKADTAIAASSDEQTEPFPITEWQGSKYYFYGKGFGGHSSAVSHVYSASRTTNSVQE
ncbi:hypothetical protein [Ursidibacter maritimus]|uniref:hypothetical protein n=1 Tax=Ursidibacter maritimus TaxID=1331689 RepID=UPI003F73EF01